MYDEISFIKSHNGNKECYIFIKSDKEKNIDEIFEKVLKIVKKIKNVEKRLDKR